MKITRIAPDAIHIATEGPIGLAARNFCVAHRIPFTSSYHTKFPEYVNKRFPWIRTEWVYNFVRWFHRESTNVLVTNEEMKRELTDHGFKNKITVWGRGTDLALFKPRPTNDAVTALKRTVLYVGRVSVEKNIEAFLDVVRDSEHAVVVGHGPMLDKLRKKYPNVEFVGKKVGEELAGYFQDADVFVFPSKTDTFGIVMIEANACGTPVAAFPVTGPNDYVIEGVNGALDKDLRAAIDRAYACSRAACVQHVEDNYTWRKSAEIFEAALVPTK
jgi:glycosyltransferase involved in cell wall biosynthesis